jgi:uncharacterized protein (TIRG00374 family)
VIRGFLKRHVVALGVSLVITGGLVWLLKQGALPVLPDRAAHEKVSWTIFPIYALFFSVTLLFRCGRWYFLLAPIHRVPMRRVLQVSFVFCGASVTLPFRLAEAVRPALIRKKDKLSAWAATGTVAAERVVDGLFASLILLLSLQFATTLDPLPERIGEFHVPAAMVPKAAYSALLLFATAFVCIFFFYVWRSTARRVTERMVGIVSPRLGHWLADKIDRLADGFRFLPQWRYSLLFLLGSLGYWLFHILGMWYVMEAAGLRGMEFAQVAAVLGVLALGMLVPNAPGFFGTFQLSIYAGLAMFRPGGEVVGQGSVAVFWLYVVQIGLCLVVGALAIWVEVRSRPREP